MERPSLALGLVPHLLARLAAAIGDRIGSVHRFALHRADEKFEFRIQGPFFTSCVGAHSHTGHNQSARTNFRRLFPNSPAAQDYVPAPADGSPRRFPKSVIMVFGNAQSKPPRFL